MKRTEIKVGEDYLVGTHHMWMQGHYRNEYVRVVDTSKVWFKSDRLTSREAKEVETDSGVRSVPGSLLPLTPDRHHKAKGVLVQILDFEGQPRTYAIYDPKYFRVPAEEGKEIVAAYLKRQTENRMAREQDQKDRANRLETLVDRAAEVGLTANGHPSQNKVAIGVDEFERLVERLESLSTLGRS